ncbi:hypothetical protein BDP81DRAFT_199871 [Colletotrichum phormii]|uniref:Uncharacterized protein n=1 Tax=Colletotrichum phormii TaxID=359342 RepID=A0AAI9ZZA6_9PEZI|nr:uncharacterized protein BDP81DRAFT_199871 [Colletotrichum phormii]KAK1639287.1 hypothetical protein BDP81DRAFT_199871 [Colletotrichum phormii]
MSTSICLFPVICGPIASPLGSSLPPPLTLRCLDCCASRRDAHRHTKPSMPSRSTTSATYRGSSSALGGFLTPATPTPSTCTSSGMDVVAKRLVSPAWLVAATQDSACTGTPSPPPVQARALSQQLGLSFGSAPPPQPHQGEVSPRRLAWWALSLHIPSCMRGLPAHQVVARDARRGT